MHTQLKYDGPDADADAMRDIIDWLSVKQWEAFFPLVRDETQPFRIIAFYMSFMGISGFPVHALGRTLCLSRYNDWLAEPEIE